jgi:hypothetical protein
MPPYARRLMTFTLFVLRALGTGSRGSPRSTTSEHAFQQMQAGKLTPVRTLGQDEEGRSRVHPPARGRGPHGRVDARHYRVLRDGKPLRKGNGMPFTLPFSPDTIRWRRAAIVELRKLGIDL